MPHATFKGHPWRAPHRIPPASLHRPLIVRLAWRSLHLPRMGRSQVSSSFHMFSCVRTGCDSSRGRESWKLSQLSQLSCSLLFDQPHCRHHRLTPDLHSHINYIQLKWPHLSPWDCPTRYKFWNVFAKPGTSGTSPGKSTGQTRGSISDHLDRHRPRFTMFHRPTIHSLGLCLAKNNLLFAL
jgi:hypothetical protein